MKDFTTDAERDFHARVMDDAKVGQLVPFKVHVNTNPDAPYELTVRATDEDGSCRLVNSIPSESMILDLALTALQNVLGEEVGAGSGRPPLRFRIQSLLRVAFENTPMYRGVTVDNEAMKATVGAVGLRSVDEPVMNPPVDAVNLKPRVCTIEQGAIVYSRRGYACRIEMIVRPGHDCTGEPRIIYTNLTKTDSPAGSGWELTESQFRDSFGDTPPVLA